jgi:predicted TIM-barrel fold metal-dependent hydrolase
VSEAFGHRVVDCDGHVVEPADDPEPLISGEPGDPKACSTIYREAIDPEYRDQVPVLFVDHDGFTRVRIEGEVLGPKGKGVGLAGALGVAASTGPERHKHRYPLGQPGGTDPHARIQDLEIDGIDSVALYPTVGLLTGAIKDQRLAAALSRAHNRWVADFCSASPDRLIGVAMLPMQSIELAVEELRYARTELGLRAAFLRPNPYNDLFLNDPEYDRLWAVAQDLDVAIGIHEGTGGGGKPSAGTDQVRTPAARHIVSHSFQMMLACLHIVWGGVCERFPDLRFAFLESGGGWVPSWLDRMDRHFAEEVTRDDQYGLRMPPSEYFRRQCWVSLEPTETTIQSVAEYCGADHVMWATDYPHIDGWFPGAPKIVASHLDEATQPLVLGTSADKFYGRA